MKKTFLTAILGITVVLFFCGVQTAKASTPDSAYIFAYATLKNYNHNGLEYAWSLDQKHWHAIGPDKSFLSCDYGQWGAQKRMLTPFLYQDKNHLWRCIWSVNERDGVFAYTQSKDLINWKPQAYPQVAEAGMNCMEPEISYVASSGNYLITWLSQNNDGKKVVYGVTTKDFLTYTPTQKLSEKDRLNSRQVIDIMYHPEMGTVHKVAWSVIQKLLQKKKLDDYNNLLYRESFKGDSARFAGLKPLNESITVQANDHKKISDMLVGAFFEDINYAADGGLYAELIQNRDFEYKLSDKKGWDKSWTAYKAWSLKGKNTTFTIDTVAPINPNNPHYAVLTISKPGAALANEGYDGIVIKAGDKYNFSFFSKEKEGRAMRIIVRLVGKSGEVLAQTTVRSSGKNWKKKTAVITALKSDNNAQLDLIPQATGTLNLDMISLFPQKTFKNRKNGLRADLAQTIANLHPHFLRFPGGCVSHGDGLANIYRWKNTIGPLEARKPQRDLWGYHQSVGLGYYEYFQFCEDIGAEPVPVIAAGVCCQNSSTGGAGQQGGIPMCDMHSYVQNILDLIQWANGDAKTTKWGKVRAKEGHPKPFNLKYIGIGNEDLISHIFETRFAMIYKAIREKYPNITVIGTVGPFYEGSDYTEGWKFADKLHVPMVDEHYYESPGWFIHNTNFYDKYDRTKSKVYLGEYASQGNRLYNALSEALYLASLERNADVVRMASYAPMLAKIGHTQWNPDLIYFNNTKVMPTVNYYVQQLYAENNGDTYYTSRVDLNNNNFEVRDRVGVSVITDSKTHDVVVKLVNLLPVEINTNVDLSNIANIQNEATKTVLTGNPNSKSVKPVVSQMKVSNKFPCKLPAYSFTVIRINMK